MFAYVMKCIWVMAHPDRKSLRLGCFWSLLGCLLNIVTARYLLSCISQELQMTDIQSVDQTAQHPKEAGDLWLNLTEVSMPSTEQWRRAKGNNSTPTRDVS